MPTFGSLFAGIGGIDLGLERAGWTGRWQVEWDEWCQRVLAKHWPDLPRYGDITAVDWSTVEPVDLVAGGFPCQPVSHVGLRKAQEDERWLWPEFLRCLRHLRPRYALLENVPGLLARGVDEVLGDLASIGYDAEWDCIPAAAVGAPHLRDRVWIVAYPNEQRREGRPGQLRPSGWAEPADGGALSNSNANDEEGLRTRSHDQGERQEQTPRPLGLLRGAWGDREWPAEPAVGRVAHGVPGRVDRIGALGNAVVPQVVEVIGRRILESEVAA